MATTFNEDNTIEQMIISTLKSNGWKYIPAEELPRMHSDVLVEPMVKEALIRLNPEIAEDPSRADEVIYKLRTVILSVQPHNLVTQNEVFKKMIFEENSYPFGKDGRMVPIRFFGTMRKEDLALNEYVVTNQWVYPQAEGGKRLDIVLLINGFPIAVGELKTPVRSAITWLDAAGDISAYEKSIPAMFVTNVFNFATEGKCYRYGSINMPINMWGPWHTATHKAEGGLADVKISIEDMITPEKVMDIFQFFTMFATDKKYRKYKIICRYQQFEGANMIVDRVVAGYPKKGLIWHFQGSGKSLLMVFAAQKLRMIPELKNPTVVIVDDRIDLETQITATFNASDIPNLTSAATKEELLSFFRGDMRKILITTIFKFGEVSGELNARDNIIVMVDEAHRTQEGDLGEKMRMALPNAFFFGLTGTPINRVDKNTFATFGAEEDRTGYMSRYSFSDSIRDGATLPLHFEPVPVELHVDKDKLDREFDAMTDEAGLSRDEKNELSRRVNMKAIMYNPARIRKVCEHIAKHFKEKIEPNGYKGQVVVYDRECCLMYKAVLDELLGEDATTIVMDTNNDKEDRYKKYRRDRDQESKVLDYFRDPHSPLKLVIVTAKLLTGFDAPILQVISPVLEAIGNVLGFIGDILGTIIGDFTGGISSIVGFFGNLFGGAKESSEEIGNLSGAIDGLDSAASAGSALTLDTSAYREDIQGAAETTTQALADSTSSAADITGQNLSQIQTSSQDTFTAMTDSSADAWNQMGADADSGSSRIVSAFQRITAAARSASSAASINIGSSIPHNAGGTDNFQGGLTWMNEEGGELAVLPSGSTIIPADQTDRIMQSYTNSTVNQTSAPTVLSPNIQIYVSGGNGADSAMQIKEQMKALFDELYREAQEKEYSRRAMQHGYA